MKNTARKLISANGSACHVERITGKEYNATTHNYENEVEMIKGVAVRTLYNEKDINGTVILIGDVMFNFVPEDGITSVPSVGDTMVFAGERYEIVNSEPVSPNGAVTLCYKLQGRK